MNKSRYKASGASLPTQEQINAGPHAELGTIPSDYARTRSLPMDPINVLTHALYKLSRAEIMQEIRELDAMKYENPVLAELCFHRINELLDLLDLAD